MREFNKSELCEFELNVRIKIKPEDLSSLFFSETLIALDTKHNAAFNVIFQNKTMEFFIDQSMLTLFEKKISIKKTALISLKNCSTYSKQMTEHIFKCVRHIWVNSKTRVNPDRSKVCVRL